MKNIGLSLLSVMVCSNVVFAAKNIEKVLEPSIVIPSIVDESTNGFYIGLAVSAVSTRESKLDFFSVIDGQDRTGDLLFSLGYDWNEYIAIEGRYMVSIAKEHIVDRKSWGIYVKPQYSVTEEFKVYGLLGLGGFDATGTNNFGDTIDTDDISLQWGLGVSYEVHEDISIFVDYVQIASDVDTTTFVTQDVDISSDAFTIGVSYHF